MLVNYTVAHSTVNQRQRKGGQSPGGAGHGQGREAQAGEQGVVINTASQVLNGMGDRYGGAKQAKVGIAVIGGRGQKKPDRTGRDQHQGQNTAEVRQSTD